MRIIEKPRDNFKRYALVLLALGFLLGSFLLYFKDNEVEAADATKFNPGNIIDDAVFYDYTTMTASDIQNFLNSKVSKCESGYTCLKDYSAETVAKSADAYCSGYNASSSQTAAQIIYGVAQSCKINPQALLVILQKEVGLVTHTGPGSWRYRTAMGMGCPDTAACDSQYYGLFNQLYGAARQYRIYQAKPSSYNYVAGRNNTILWSPTSSCGSSTVYIENQATAGLYNYTPYRPNQAALNAGYGTGDSCSSYGNRNFWLYFTDWFGSTQITVAKELSSKATNILTAGQQLNPGEFLTSPNGNYVLIMQYSGQLVLYNKKIPMWQSSGIDWSQENASFVFQQDGNLVIYKDDIPIWASSTNHSDVGSLVLQNDGNLVLYRESGEPIWSSNTGGNDDSWIYKGTRLATGQILGTNEFIRSADWRYFLKMQNDGNLVIYMAGDTPLWSSGTSGKIVSYLKMQNDGNLVIYQQNGGPTWSSGSNAKGSSFSLEMQSDGNLVIYNTPNVNVTWSSNTGGVKDDSVQLTMQDDRNLVVYDKNGRAIWHSNSNGSPTGDMVVQDDGNLVIYDKNNKAIWASNTGGHKPSETNVHTGCKNITSSRLLANKTIGAETSLCSSNGHYLLAMQNDSNLVMYSQPATYASWSIHMSQVFYKSNMNL